MNQLATGKYISRKRTGLQKACVKNWKFYTIENLAKVS